MNEGSTESDRRSFFRVHDRVALRVRALDEEALAGVIEAKEAEARSPDSLASAFAAANVQMKHGIDKCKRDFPEVAACLEGLNAKVDLLVRMLVANDNDLPDRPTHRINLSASGLSYRSWEPLQAGTPLELKVLFFPSFLFLHVFGRVVRCHDEGEDPEGRHQIAVEFTHIGEDDRELLIRHVLQRESAILREARNAFDAEA